MSAWWEANIVLYIKVARWSYDDRMTVVRCRTILDWVLRRRTIIDEVVWRHRTSIAQISCDEPRRRKMRIYSESVSESGGKSVFDVMTFFYVVTQSLT